MDKFPEHITAIVGAGAVLDFKYDYSNAFIPLGGISYVIRLWHSLKNVSIICALSMSLFSVH